LVSRKKMCDVKEWIDTLQNLTTKFYQEQCLDVQEMLQSLYNIVFKPHQIRFDDLLTVEFYKLLFAHGVLPPEYSKSKENLLKHTSFIWLKDLTQTIDNMIISQDTPLCVFLMMVLYKHADKYLSRQVEYSRHILDAGGQKSLIVELSKYWKTIALARNNKEKHVSIAGFMSVFFNFYILLTLLDVLHVEATNAGLESIEPFILAHSNGVIKTHLELMFLWQESVAEEIDLLGKSMLCMPLPLLTQQLSDIVYQSAISWDLIAETKNPIVFFQQRWNKPSKGYPKTLKVRELEEEEEEKDSEVDDFAIDDEDDDAEIVQEGKSKECYAPSKQPKRIIFDFARANQKQKSK
jgi:hypothetical protein